MGEEEFPEPITPSEVPNAVQQFNLGQQDDFSSGLPVQPPAPPIEEAPLPLDYGGTDWFTGGVPQGPTADLPTMGYAESAPLPLDYGGDDWFSGSDAAPVAAPAIPGPEEVRQRLAEQKRAKATISVMEEDGAPPDALDSIDPKQDYKRTAKRNKVLSQKPEEISALQNFGNAFEVGFKNMTKGDLYYDLIKRDHAEAARYLAKLEADNPTYEGDV